MSRLGRLIVPQFSKRSWCSASVACELRAERVLLRIPSFSLRCCVLVRTYAATQNGRFCNRVILAISTGGSSNPFNWKNILRMDCLLGVFCIWLHFRQDYAKDYCGRRIGEYKSVMVAIPAGTAASLRIKNGSAGTRRTHLRQRDCGRDAVGDLA